jgi:polyisoprenyl-phosphate glycosyltransferase
MAVSRENSDSEQKGVPTLTVVVPCYNEQDVLPETVARLSTLLADLRDEYAILPASSLLLVDDGSRDKTWSMIEQFAASIDSVHGLKLTRNCGHQLALLAGMLAAKGDVIVTIDADLQDDIGAISPMLSAYRAGTDIVYGVRKSRDTDTAFKRFTAELYYRLLRWMGVSVVFNHADYRLLSRRAIESLRDYEEANLFVRGLVPLLGFPSAVVEYSRGARLAGDSKYPLRKMLGLALDGITSFTAFPLRLITYLGLVVALGSLVFALWTLYVRLFGNGAVPGWASTVVPIYFIGGVQLFSLGVIGEYLAKIYMETKRRPRFHIEKEI